MTVSLRRRLRAFMLSGVAPALAFCAGAERAVHYQCETGGDFTVRYTADRALFEYRGNAYSLPATEKDGDFRDDAMRLKTVDGEVSLQRGDQVVIWGCKPLDHLP